MCAGCRVLEGHELAHLHATLDSTVPDWAGGERTGTQGNAVGSESDQRDTGCWFPYGSVLPSLPGVGAVCGKAAPRI